MCPAWSDKVDFGWTDNVGRYSIRTNSLSVDSGLYSTLSQTSSGVPISAAKRCHLPLTFTNRSLGSDCTNTRLCNKESDLGKFDDFQYLPYVEYLQDRKYSQGGKYRSSSVRFRFGKH